MGKPTKRTKKTAASVLAAACRFKSNKGKSKRSHMHDAIDNKPTMTVVPEVLEGGRLKLQSFALLFMQLIIAIAGA